MTALPAFYRYLEDGRVLPRTIAEALKCYGVHEAPGLSNNPTIMGWKKELQAAGVIVDGYSADSVPWCGLFAALVCVRAGKIPVKAPLWALTWRSFGVEAKPPSLGDVLVFSRNGGGHVTFYVGEDATYYHCLGGNQSDAVTITRIAKARCVAARSPVYTDRPTSAVPIHLSASGPISTNEA